LNALAEASGNQPRVGVALGAAITEALARLPRGPSGSGSRDRPAFAARSSPPTARRKRRAAGSSGPFAAPDLVWLRPKGMSHAVADASS
jgi:hypothetical protein